MIHKRRTVGAGDFKERCGEVLEEVTTSGTKAIVTKRGRPIVGVEPQKLEEWQTLAGTLLWEADDIITPIPGVWDEDV